MAQALRPADLVLVDVAAVAAAEIPAGVDALRDLLDMLEEERLAEEDCASTFP